MRILDPAAPDLAEFVRPADTIAWGQGPAEPRTLTRALVAQRRSLGPVRIFTGIASSDTLMPEHADRIEFLSYCGSGNNRRLAQAGVLDIFPAHYSELPGMIASGALRIDVAMVQLAPADREGRYSLGVACDYLLAAIANARVVLAEINDQVPWTCGERVLMERDLDAALHVSAALPEQCAGKSGAVEAAIGRHVAGLVEDGATLQIGIGSIPEAILGALDGHRELGVHTGVMGDAVVRLMQRGVITNSRKTIDRGATVTGLAMGSRGTYRFLDRNPAVRFRSAGYTHDQEVLSNIDRFVAINSALEVDLTGQVNAEIADGVYVGAVGGAVDFLRAAARSAGGVPVVALPSRAGTRSRIVARLEGPVTTARSDAGFIVTEHGVADLRGASLSVRIARMLAIADPAEREALAREACAGRLRRSAAA